MGLFKRSSSVSSQGSSNVVSDTSSQTSVSSSSKDKVVKPSDLNFANTASPNSRLLALGSPSDESAPLQRTFSSASNKSGKSNGGSGGRTPSVSSGTGSRSSRAEAGAVGAAGASIAAGGAMAARRGSQSSKTQKKEESLSEESEEEESEEEEEKPAPKPVKRGSSTSSVPKVAAVSGKTSKKAESESESESEESEEDEAPAPPKKNAPKPVSRTSSSSATKTNGKGGGAAAVASSKRTESPVEWSDEDSEEESIESYVSSESEPVSDDEDAVRRKASAALGTKMSGGKNKPRSRAATLAAEAMDTPITAARQKKNKALASLTYDDVKLTDKDMKEDISIIWKAMHLFMNSRMTEAEDICLSAADHRLYYSVGYSLIQVIKSLATFEPEDLQAAVDCCSDSIVITQLLRKKDHSMLDKSLRITKGSTSVGSIKSMTLVQRHAELIYAECTLLKAVVGIIYSGDFVAFLKEAINMRNAYAIYRTLAKYVETMDEAYGGGEDPSIDQDFRSGVFLGNGLISLILSLLPSTVLKIMSVFGFSGNREEALKMLMRPGGWKAGVKEPGTDVTLEGIRRQVCDMVLLTHHLVIASYLPVGKVDVPTAGNILHFNLDRYPNGVFFLYFAGRLHSTETSLDPAIKAFHRAIQAQREYIQLAHICYWDLGLVSLAKGDYVKGYECFNILDKESNWSKAIYAYAKATTLYEEGEDISSANNIMKNVPDLMQRIAGKSIPLEKFVARRSRKFVAQGNRLCLPGIELAYVLNCLQLSPRFILFDIHLDQVSSTLAELHKVKDPKSYGNGDEFWDDYCLAHLLRGIILRFIAHPEAHTKPDPPKSQIPVKEADEQAMISFNNVFKHGRELQHDHHLVWFAHYEMGRLYDAMGQYPKAIEQYNVVMSGKNLEISGKKGKGKVSLQNMAVLRSSGALDVLRESGKIQRSLEPFAQWTRSGGLHVRHETGIQPAIKCGAALAFFATFVPLSLPFLPLPSPLMEILTHLLLSTSSSSKSQPTVSWVNVGLSLALTAACAIMALLLKLEISSSLMIAAMRCIIQLTVMGYILEAVFTAQSPWAVAAMSVAMILLGANEVTYSRSNRRPQGLFFSSLTSLLFSVIPIAIFGAKFAIVHTPFWSPQSFIPIIGMITGNAISGMAVATSVVLREVVDNRDRIETYLAYGASRTEACTPVAREALRLALLPTVNQMSVIGLISIPGMMTGAILGGESTDRAAKMQMIIMFLITGTTTLCVTLSVLFSLSVLVDGMHRVRLDRVQGNEGNWVVKNLSSGFGYVLAKMKGCFGKREGRIALE